MAGQGGDQPPISKPTVHKQNYEKDIIYLYQFSRTPLLPSLSPYCLKVETWLRLAGLKYEVSLCGLHCGLGCHWTLVIAAAMILGLEFKARTHRVRGPTDMLFTLHGKVVCCINVDPNGYRHELTWNMTAEIIWFEIW